MNNFMKINLKTRIIAAGIFFGAASFLMADEDELLVWVRYDAEKKIKTFSDGRPAPEWAIPGQFYEVEDGRTKKEKQWRNPLDLLKTYKPRGISRVEFSHDRHFAAMKDTNCKKCHEGDTEIGNIRFPSNAPSPSAESHGDGSAGRFCSRCHNGSVKKDIYPERIFTAFGRTGDKSCGTCHAPSGHGFDFTNEHGETAEHSAASECASCHRGADRSSASEKNQALAFKKSRLVLINNPEDEAAFKNLLPENFCRYCHIEDSSFLE